MSDAVAINKLLRRIRNEIWPRKVIDLNRSSRDDLSNKVAALETDVAGLRKVVVQLRTDLEGFAEVSDRTMLSFERQLLETQSSDRN